MKNHFILNTKHTHTIIQCHHTRSFRRGTAKLYISPDLDTQQKPYIAYDDEGS